MNIPNTLTVARIALIPLLIIVFYTNFQSSNLLSAIIFALAGFTDWLDGYLARTLKQTSKLGEFLDPVADKLIVAVALTLLVGEKGLPYLTIPAAIIIGREIAVSALREWMANMGNRTSVAVSFLGKIKTAFQMSAIFLLLIYEPDSFLWTGWLGYGLLWLAASLTLISMCVYLKAAWKDLTA